MPGGTTTYVGERRWDDASRDEREADGGTHGPMTAAYGKGLLRSPTVRTYSIPLIARIPNLQKGRLMRRVVLLAAVVLLVVPIPGCLDDGVGSRLVDVLDVYCDNNGHFNFTIRSNVEDALAVEYWWSLNDPMCDVLIMEGTGDATLNGSARSQVVILLEYRAGNRDDFDARFYVMHVKVSHDGKTVARYDDQKSTYDWDYSRLPPTKND